jgi:hypothetical protein
MYSEDRPVTDRSANETTGPQVYGIAYCKVSYTEELSQLGFFGQSFSRNDSSTQNGTSR